MSTAQPEAKTVKRVCRVVRTETRHPCGKVYRVEKYSRSLGCPDCCPRLAV